MIKPLYTFCYLFRISCCRASYMEFLIKLFTVYYGIAFSHKSACNAALEFIQNKVSIFGIDANYVDSQPEHFSHSVTMRKICCMQIILF